MASVECVRLAQLSASDFSVIAVGERRGGGAGADGWPRPGAGHRRGRLRVRVAGQHELSAGAGERRACRAQRATNQVRVEALRGADDARGLARRPRRASRSRSRRREAGDRAPPQRQRHAAAAIRAGERRRDRPSRGRRGRSGLASRRLRGGTWAAGRDARGRHPSTAEPPWPG